ncbi:MAG: hypothetical protein Q7T55_24500 [Solirubrobacteraceae bacterium]|nr:hypothetical protein [Solirubrobacteraceae bacterium]
MSRPAPSTARTAVVLLLAASLLGWLPRLRRSGSIRSHIELLQKVAPIEQFAQVAGQRSFVDLAGRLDLTIVVHRARADLPYLFVPIDDRELAGWLN